VKLTFPLEVTGGPVYAGGTEEVDEDEEVVKLVLDESVESDKVEEVEDEALDLAEVEVELATVEVVEDNETRVLVEDRLELEVDSVMLEAVRLPVEVDELVLDDAEVRVEVVVVEFSE
jgi:hypothetical protein